MNELILPFKISVRIGKAENKASLAAGLCWLSFKIFFMGIKRLID